MTALWKICPDYNVVIVDHNVDVHNLSDVAWRTLGNVDWRRDSVISVGETDHYAPADSARGHIGIDATSKDATDGHPRSWPEELFMSPEIVALVDKKWKSYGIK
jgi:4-hydroxy-3-polyprenylbenzoate decarboxylase